MAFPVYTIRMLAGAISGGQTLVSATVPNQRRWVVKNVVFAVSQAGPGPFLVIIPGIGFLVDLPTSTAPVVTVQEHGQVLNQGEHLEASFGGTTGAGTVMITGWELDIS